MQTAHLNTIELHEARYEYAPAIRSTVNFPYYAGTGNLRPHAAAVQSACGHHPSRPPPDRYPPAHNPLAAP